MKDAVDYPPNTVAVFDLDGTLTRRDTYLGILAHSLRGRPAAAARLVHLARPVAAFRLGRLDRTTLKAAFLKNLLADLPASRLDTLTRSFLDRLFAGGLRQAAIDALSAHREAGHVTVLLSASPDFYVEPLAHRLRFDHCLCTGTARRADHSLSGELTTPNCHGEEKLVRLRVLFGDAFDQHYFIGYGDHESDLPLLKRLDVGVMINPDRGTRDKARRAGLEIATWR